MNCHISPPVISINFYMVANKEWIFKYGTTIVNLFHTSAGEKEDKISNVFITTKTNVAKISLKRKKKTFFSSPITS